MGKIFNCAKKCKISLKTNNFIIKMYQIFLFFVEKIKNQHFPDLKYSNFLSFTHTL